MIARRLLRGLRRLRAEHGVTLVETVVAISLFTIVTTMTMSVVGNALKTTNRMESQSDALDQDRIAFLTIARELRSAECIHEPAENTTGTTLRFTTYANNSFYEVTYAVSGTSLLRSVTGVAGSTVVATSLVNTSDIFQQVSTPRRTMTLTLRAQLDSHQTPRLLTTTVAGRNAWRTC
jgi:type II secretory pathway component PulJ